MKKILVYTALLIALFSLLIVLPLTYLVLSDATSIEIVKQNCLTTGGTVVEFQGKFERCIPR